MRISSQEWHAVYHLVSKAAEAMLAEPVTDKTGQKIGLHLIGKEEDAPVELSLDTLVKMNREGRPEDILKYVQVTCCTIDGAPKPNIGRVVTLNDDFCYAWTGHDWKRMFEY